MLVDGVQSNSILLEDMIFQGTVLGPALWNSFFHEEDSNNDTRAESKKNDAKSDTKFTKADFRANYRYNDFMRKLKECFNLDLYEI